MEEATQSIRGASPYNRSIRARRSSFVWGVLGLLLCQCTAIERGTRLSITLDAEPSLRARIAHVDLAFYTAISPDAFRMRAQERLRPENDRAWPLKWAFARSNSADVRYSLEAEALDANGKTLAQLRAVGAFRDQETVELELTFDASCQEDCGEGRTCRDGTCVDAELVTNMSMVVGPSTSPPSKPADPGPSDSDSAMRSAPTQTTGACSGDSCSPQLLDLRVQGAALDPSFQPEIRDYTLQTGLIANQWSVTPSAAAGATLTLNGEPLTGGITPQLLAAGAERLVLGVSAPQSQASSVQYKLAIKAKGQELSMVKAGTPTADAHFGTKVVLAGDTMVVTATGDASSARGVNPDDPPRDGAANSGAAYVFRRSGSDWQQEAYIKASDTSKDAEYGKCAALQGDTLLVGAWKENDQGAVYVYQRSGTSWRELQKIVSEPRQNGANFGQSVAILDDVLVIGAGSHDLTANDTGAAFLYRRNPDQSWSFDRIIAPGTLGTLSWFGSSVLFTRDYLLVGATGVANGTLEGGTAYLFHADTFELVDPLKPPSGGTAGFFGEYMALEGDTVVISSFNNNGGLSSGTVYVYAPGADGHFEPKLTLQASNANGGDLFGTGLALSADYLLVGAAGESSAAKGINGSLNGSSSISNSGAAYLFARTGTTDFRQVAHIKASEPADGAHFGSNVILDGSDIAIAADGDAHAANGSGAVYMFH